MDADVGCRHVRTAHLALRRAHRDRAVQAVLAPLAERDFDDAARRVGIVVGAGDGHHLDFLNLLGPQRAQVGEQLLGLHAQLAVVDEDLRAALAVDGYLVVAHPDARRLFEQLDAVAPDGRGGVGHVDHEAVGFAADELRLDGHPFDLGRRGAERQVAQFAVGGELHVAVDGFVADILDAEVVLARRDAQFEATLLVGGHPRHLLFVAQQHDGGVCHGIALFVDHAASGREHAGREELREGEHQCK